MDGKALENLGDENLDEVAGGYIFNAQQLNSFGSPGYYWPWEVIDSKGNVVVSSDTREGAVYSAEKRGLSTTELTWEQLQKLRETGSPY